MTQLIKKTAVCLLVLATMAGCATVPDSVRDDEPVDTQTTSRATKTLITIGGILLLAAIVVNEAEDNVDDAIRNAARP